MAFLISERLHIYYSPEEVRTHHVRVHAWITRCRLSMEVFLFFYGDVFSVYKVVSVNVSISPESTRCLYLKYGQYPKRTLVATTVRAFLLGLPTVVRGTSDQRTYIRTFVI